MPPKKMDAKVSALESEVANLKVTLAEMKAQAAADQERLVSLLTQSKEVGSPGGSMGKSKSGGESNNNEEDEVRKLLQKLQDEALVEFQQSAKKVELPMFEGDDPAGWIARAEIYFKVQSTRPELKVNLAQLCMDGPTIHFFQVVA